MHNVNSDFFDKRHSTKIVLNVIGGEEYRFLIASEDENKNLVDWLRKLLDQYVKENELFKEGEIKYIIDFLSFCDDI